MNWGNKLILVFVAFGSLLGYMVYRCMQVPVNLVAKEYYRDELAYQQVIDSKQMAAGLSSKVKLTQEKGKIHIQLPAEMSAQDVRGEVFFYNAADAARDQRFTLQLDNEAGQQISTEALVPGRYLVKTSWETRTEKYFSEEPFTVQ